MSEYQYYEFQSLERSLTNDELNQRLSKLISLPPSSEPPQRTIEQLLTESETQRKKEELRQD
jgi:hypothetical protein